MSTFGKGIGSLIFLEALLAAKEEGLSLESEGDRLALGKVAPADRVLDHLFFFLSSPDRSAPGGEEGAFDQPVEDSC
jgi:hypothetical protein